MSSLADMNRSQRGGLSGTSGTNSVPDIEEMLAGLEDADTNIGKGTATVETQPSLPQPPVIDRPSDPGRTDIVRFKCGHCDRKVRAKKSQAGQKMSCPGCQQALRIPGDKSSNGTPADGGKKYLRLGESLGSLEEHAKPDRKRHTLPRGRLKQLTKVLAVPVQDPEFDMQQLKDAVRDLGQSGDPRAGDLLLPLLDERLVEIKHAAVTTLGDLGYRPAVGPLVKSLAEPSEVIRKTVCIALGKIGDVRTVPVLLSLGLDCPSAKPAAADAVAAFGEEAGAHLIGSLDHSDAGVVLEAVVLLGRIKHAKAARSLLALLGTQTDVIRTHAVQALADIGDKRAAPMVAKLLRDPNAVVRTSAAKAVGVLGDKNSVPHLMKCLADDDADVLHESILALGNIGEPRAAGNLAPFLKSSDHRLQLAAAEALGELGDPHSVPGLLELLSNSDEKTQLKVLSILRKLKDPQTVPALLSWVHDPRDTIRQRAVDALGGAGDADAAEELESILRSDRSAEVRAAAARSLGEIADPISVDCLRSALFDEFIVRCQAITALGVIGDAEATPDLLRLLNEPVPEVKYHTSIALGKIGAAEAVAPITSLLADKNQMVVRGATKALELLGKPQTEADVKKAKTRRKAKAIRSATAGLTSFLPESPRVRLTIVGSVLGITLLVAAGAFLFRGGGDAPIVLRGNVSRVSFSPDGSQVAVGREFGAVEIWNVDTGERTKQLSPPGGSTAMFGGDGNSLAVAKQGEFGLFPLDGAEPTITKAHNQGISKFAFSADRSVACTFSADGVAVVWDMKTGKHKAALELAMRGVTALAVSPDGGILACGTNTGQTYVWDATTGEEVTQFSAQRAVLTDLAFSGDGNLLIGSFGRSGLLVWSMKSNQQLVALGTDVKEHFSQVRYHPKADQLVAVAGSRIYVWDMAKPSNPPEPQVLSVNDCSGIETMAFHPDGKMVAIGNSEDTQVWVYDISAGREVKVLDET